MSNRSCGQSHFVFRKGYATKPETGTKAVSNEEGKGNAISAGSTTGPLLEVKCMVALAEAWNETVQVLNYDTFRASMERDHVGELT